MVIEDNQMRLLLFAKLIEPRTLGAPFLDAGLREDQLAALRELDAGELAKLARMRTPRMRVELDPPELDHGLRQLRHEQQRAAHIDYFICHHATTAMLASLFKLSSAEIARLRKKHGTQAQRRPSMPDPPRREAICADWHALRRNRREAVAAEDYRRLHEKHPDLTLATLHRVVHEFAT